jgi:hypothetical protein
MNKFIVVKLWILVTCFSLFSFKAGNYKKLTGIETKSSHFTTDNLQNFYLIEGNSIVKYDATGLKQREFSEVKYGRPGLIEAGNPLNILVLYPQNGTALILDRQLTLLQSIQFKNLGYQDIKAACLSRDNKIWIFDSKENKLKLFDYNGQLIRSTDDVAQLIGKGIRPNYMFADQNNLYVNDVSNGVFIFDTYGDYHKQFFIKGLRTFQVINDQLIYLKKKQLKVFSLKSFDELDFSLPDSVDVKQARIEQNRLYLLHKNELTLYEF